MAIRIRRADEVEQKPAEKILEGLKEALAVAKGEAEPAAVHVRRPKKALTLRIDEDVIEKFRATGYGWQTRMNEALRKAAGL